MLVRTEIEVSPTRMRQCNDSARARKAVLRRTDLGMEGFPQSSCSRQEPARGLGHVAPSGPAAIGSSPVTRRATASWPDGPGTAGGPSGTRRCGATPMASSQPSRRPAGAGQSPRSSRSARARFICSRRNLPGWTERGSSVPTALSTSVCVTRPASPRPPSTSGSPLPRASSSASRAGAASGRRSRTSSSRGPRRRRPRPASCSRPPRWHGRSESGTRSSPGWWRLPVGRSSRSRLSGRRTRATSFIRPLAFWR
jgi:hypothetical protein